MAWYFFYDVTVDSYFDLNPMIKRGKMTIDQIEVKS